MSKCNSTLKGLIVATEPLHQVCSIRFRSAVSTRTSYVSYLIQTYHYIVASVPLMELALEARFGREEPVFGRYLTRHIEEERNHDQWLLRDLAALGVDAQAVCRSLPFPATLQLVGAQYYTIKHLHPLGLLGYIYALESAPPTRVFLDGLVRRLGIPERAVMTLREHGENDLEHRQDLFSLISDYPFNSFQRDLLLYSAQNTLHSLFALMSSLRGVNRGTVGSYTP